MSAQHTPTPWFVFGRPGKEFATRAEAEAYAATLEGEWEVDYREPVHPIPKAHPLAPCPRCGAEAHIVRPAPRNHYIACKACQLTFGDNGGHAARDVPELSAAWNERACSAHDELVDALRHAETWITAARVAGGFNDSNVSQIISAALAKAGAA